MSDKDTYETPIDLFKNLDAEFRFGFDVCAGHLTAKCPEYWTVEDDALTKDWAKDTNNIFGHYLWCNPPYSKIRPWVDKAIEAQANGKGTVMLAFCDPSSKWFAAAVSHASETRFVTNGRLSFYLNGKKKSGNDRPSVIFVFDPHRVGTGHVSFVDRSTLMKKR